MQICQTNIKENVNFSKFGKINKPDSLQLTNLWSFESCDKDYGMKYPGRMPGQIVENLLWYYTEPFDLVVDPMAGGGTTIDVCLKMCRRIKAFD